MTTESNQPILSFATQEQWNDWLDVNHLHASGVWIRFFKKNSHIVSLTYAEALDVALCYGWIDSQVKKYDQQSYIQRFTPRKSKSIWSKINTAHIERLIKEGKMQPAGLKLVEAAKKEGRWQSAYDSPKNSSPPKDFLEALAKNKKAKLYFASLNKANIYAITWRLQTAKKPETRAKRMSKILEMLARNEKFH